MRKHTKIYFNHFNVKYDQSGWHDFIPCEICSDKAVDIHHIVARGMGGSKNKDQINNLMALCRTCHEKMGDKKGYMDFLINRHQEKIRSYEKNNS
jgi:5-methylcytosine-specific restriction endonuclease McrA